MIRLILFLALAFTASAQFTFRDVGLGGLLNRSTVASGQSYLSGAELTGLTAYYRMDAAAGEDETNHNASVTPILYASNIVSQVGSVTGVITNARLTSNSGKAFLASNNGIFEAPSKDWTWVMWLKQTNATAAQFINCKYDGTPDNSQYLLYATGGQLWFNTFGNHPDVDGCCNPITVYTESALMTSTNISLNTWYYVAFGMSSGEMFISVNGGAKQTLVPTDAMQAGSSPRLTIGAYLNGGANNFSGALDEMIYYDGTAKGITEIQSIYNGGLGKTLAP